MKKRTTIVACGAVYLALIPCLGFAGRLESLAKAMPFVRSQIRSAPCGYRYYGTGDSGHWAVQCSQQVAAALAILSETPADELKRAGFRETPEELRELALSLFRYSFHTHVTGDADATDGARWGKTWISVLGLERSSGGLNLLLSRMSDDDRARLKRLLTFESDFRLNEYEITAGLTKGNKPESNLWNAGILFRTAADYPDLPQAEAYREKARRMMLNGIVNELDRDEPWYVGPQFTRNWSLDHHGYMNVGYSYECFSNLAFLHFCMKDRGQVPPPETMHRVRELWETVKRFTFPDGRLDRIGGDTRVRYGYCQIFAIQAWYFIADVLGDPDALRFAREYEKKIFAEQDANPDGSYFGKRLASVRKASVSYYDRLEADVFFTLAYAHHWERRYGLRADDRPVEIVREEQWSDDYHRSMFIRNPKSYRSVTFRAQAGIGLRNGVPTVVCAPTADSSLAEWWGNGIGFVGCQREHDWFEETPDEWPVDAFAMRSFKDGDSMAFEESFSCPVAEQRVFAEGEKPYRFGRRDTKVVALGDGVTMAVRDRVSIDRTIALEHGFRGVNWLVPNDVMNGFWRTFAGGGRRLTVDDRLSVISVKGGDLRRTPVEIPFNHNPFAHPLASLKAESIYSAGTTEPVVAEAGTILFDVVYLVSAVGDEQGEGLLASAAWDEASDALSLVGADGRSRRLDLSLGTVPPPEATGRKLVERFLSREPEDWNYHPGQKLMYWVVCAWYGAMDFAERIGDRELLKRLTDRFEPFFGKKAERCPEWRHVDYSMFGALPLSVYRRTGDLRCKEMGLGYADRQWMPKGGADDKWLEQGFTPETRLWMDDMHQITILQLEAFKVTGDRKYADRAAKEMVLYLDRLQNPDGLFYHTVETPFVWGRGDGWMAAGMAMLMKKLPADQPELPRIMSGYRKMMDALLKTQRPDGLWGQLVGDPDIWAETSCSAMFAYAFAVGVNQGWLDRKAYGPAVRRAYRGLCAKLTAEGDLTEVCVGTNAKNDRQWYVNRPRKAGDLHGQAPFIWLCAELAKGVAPSKCHREHLEDGIMAIVHFGLNTFADKEWGYGDTPPSAFNPTRLDTDQWVEAMMAGGIRRVVMVTKHHDGFNLWPSPYNADYTVANSPWRDGKGDVVALIRKSCLDRGLRFGTYLSPWDRHQASYAKPEYVTYYHRQFDELFEKYGPLSEIWLDGANGGDGYYGGARERRKLPVEAWDYYRIPDVLDRMLARYPDAIAFGGRGRSSARWVGNEAGYAPAIVEYVTDRGFWETPECDTPLRKGWFWHPNEAPKPLSHLVDIYFNSVGRGCVLNLGIAPNREGLVGEDDVRRLKEFGDYVRAFNAVDFAKDATVYRFPGIYQIDLSAETEVNAVDVMENLEFGQKIRSWKFEVEKDGRWQPVLESATVGYRRIERFDAVKARKFRVVVTESEKGAYLDRVALRFARTVPQEPNAEIPRRYFANAGVEVITAQGERACDFIAEWRFPGKVRGFKFDPRHNLGNLPDRWELRLSEDGKAWGAVVQEGEFGNILANPVEQFVEFPKELKIRYAKLTAVHAAKGEASFNPAHKHCIIFF